MITSPTASPATDDCDKIREDWLTRLVALIDQVEHWCVGLGWATKRIDKKLEDRAIGSHRVPALLMQEGVARIILEPIARSAPGSDGVADLDRLPADDDIATLFYQQGQWQLRYPLPADPITTRDEVVELQPLTAEKMERALTELARDAS